MSKAPLRVAYGIIIMLMLLIGGGAYTLISLKRDKAAQSEQIERLRERYRATRNTLDTLIVNQRTIITKLEHIDSHMEARR